MDSVQNPSAAKGMKCCQCGPRGYKCRRCCCALTGRGCNNCSAKLCRSKNRLSPENERKKVKKKRTSEGINKGSKNVDRSTEGGKRGEGGHTKNGNETQEQLNHEINCLLKSVRCSEKIRVEDVEKDGNCFFRCISLALHGTQDHHEEIRKAIVETEKKDADFYAKLVEGDFHSHLQNMTESNGHTSTYGTTAEIYAASERYNLDIFLQLPGKDGYRIERISRLEKCDHRRNFMGLRCEHDHFKKLTFDERPCSCPSEKDRVEDRLKETHSTASEESILWKGLTLDEAISWVNDVYQEVVFWRTHFLFEPPVCKATSKMINEITKLINEYNQNSPYGKFALKLIMILPNLLLQKPHRDSKYSENIASMQRRLSLWENGEIQVLLGEANMKQSRVEEHRSGRNIEEDEPRKFGNLMKVGKVNPALRILAEDHPKGILPLTRETRQALMDKHPPSRKPPNHTKLEGPTSPPDACLFEAITGRTVWKKAVKTQGGAGPSGLNARFWRTILSKKKFGEAAADLSKAVAKLAIKLATEECPNIDALTACRLIPLDKSPGVRPIGIGETLTRILGKCIMEVVKKDVKRASGNLQVCAGHQAGGEAAIHAVREMYESTSTEGILLVDATNAFNSINREAMLHNIAIKCPTLSQYVNNSYGQPSDLYINGGNRFKKQDTLQSAEGTTQGDPVAMAMYSIGMSVLQNKLNSLNPDIKEVAYADDMLGLGKLEKLKLWWDSVERLGPDFGFFPNASKSVLIVKPESFDLAKRIFEGTMVQVKDSGHRYLGAVLGSKQYEEQFVQGKVNEWIKEVCKLSDIAQTEPHAAYSAFVYGLKHKWNYLSRTVPNIDNLLKPLENCIRNTFIPTLTKGHQCSDTERDLLALPPRLGGLGIVNPSKSADLEYSNSKRLTATLSSYILAQNENGEIDEMEIRKHKTDISKKRQKAQERELKRIMECLSDKMKKKVEMAQETGASNWLTSLPIRAKGFSLNKQELRDAIALRYGWPIEGLPDLCSCGDDFDEEHAMICQKGGFICIRHDEVKYVTAKILREICHDVKTEPMLIPLTGEKFRYKTASTSNDARVDISAHGFWTRGEKAYFDIRIFDPLAASHQKQDLQSAHRKNENDKMRKYGERIRQVEQGRFTPLVFTTSGGMGPSATAFFARVADIMSEKKHEPRSHFVAWLRVRLSFSLLRSSLLCLRGSRTSRLKNVNMHELDFEDVTSESRIL